jgi:glutamate-ammonia-ligase adenylyltransferase
LQSPRNAQALATEIKAMRQKMHAAHPAREGFFDVKHDSGGLVDAEFVVQYLVLAQSSQHAELTRNSGTIALLGACAQLGLLPRDIATHAQSAYRRLRVEQHRLKLAGHDFAQIAEPALTAERKAIRDLWQQVFDATSTRSDD